jgi:hypothetical protein
MKFDKYKLDDWEKINERQYTRKVSNLNKVSGITLYVEDNEWKIACTGAISNCHNDFIRFIKKELSFSIIQINEAKEYADQLIEKYNKNKAFL